MILFAAFVGAFVATLAYPDATVSTVGWVFDHLGYILAVSAVLDGLILLAIARSRGWVGRADR